MSRIKLTKRLLVNQQMPIPEGTLIVDMEKSDNDEEINIKEELIES